MLAPHPDLKQRGGRVIGHLFCLGSFHLNSRPEFFLACWFHLALTFGAGVLIPDADVVAATVETKPANFAPVGWRHIGDDASDYNILDRLAVWARHGCDLLAEEAAPLVNLSLIPTRGAAIFQFPSHK